MIPVEEFVIKLIDALEEIEKNKKNGFSRKKTCSFVLSGREMVYSQTTVQ